MRLLVCSALLLSACIGDVVLPVPDPQQPPQGGSPGGGYTGTEDPIQTTPDGGVWTPTTDASVPSQPGSGSGSGSIPNPTSGTGSDSGGGAGDWDASVDPPDARPAEPVPQVTLEDPCAEGTTRLAANARIREIALYQAVKIPLLQNGRWVTERVAPVVQNKRSLVRVFVDPVAGASSRNVRGVLTLDNGGEETQLVAELTPRASSTDAELSTTFNYELEPEQIGADTRLRFSLIDTDCSAAAPAPNEGARFPASGKQALEAAEIRALHVVLVPVRYNNLLPDTSDTRVAAIRDALLRHYPVPDVQVSVREPITWSYTLTSSGTGWSELLNEIRRTRQRDGVARNVYYYGLVTPQQSFNTYCRLGCILGLAPQTTFVSPNDQTGLGVGFPHETTESTIVHELGHAHGRGHAPCAPRGSSIQGVDRSYPYTEAAIGTWGWDSGTKALVAPTIKDVMGYCDPTWISDYTYRGLASRSLTVNASANLLAKSVGPREVWQGLILYEGGEARWAGLSSDEVPGHREVARVLGGDGGVLTTVDIARVPLDHAGDAFVYIPEPESDWWALELQDGTRLVLDDILPAL
jgi:hypothetical protein